MALLVAVADDDVSDQVLETGVRLGEAFGEPLSVVHLTTEQHADASDRAVRDKVKATLSGRPIEYSVGIEHVGGGGSAPAVGDRLAEIATDTDISHIVVGQRSKGLLGRLLTGNTAVEVARATSVPVTIVPE